MGFGFTSNDASRFVWMNEKLALKREPGKSDKLQFVANFLSSAHDKLKFVGLAGAIDSLGRFAYKCAKKGTI